MARKDKNKGNNGNGDEGKKKPPPKHEHNYKIKNQVDTPQRGGGTKHEIQWNCTCGEWIAGEMWWD